MPSGKFIFVYANVSRNPKIPGIQTLLREINESTLPVNVSMKGEKRLSNDFMKRVD